MTITASIHQKTHAEELCNLRKRFTADEGCFFKTLFADFAFGLAFFDGESKQQSNFPELLLGATLLHLLTSHLLSNLSNTPAFTLLTISRSVRSKASIVSRLTGSTGKSS